MSPTAVVAATAMARERGLTTVTFAHADIATPRGYDARFSMIINSKLFHSLPLADRHNRHDHLTHRGIRYICSKPRELDSPPIERRLRHTCAVAVHNSASNVSRSSAVLSTCGDTRSTGPAISNGARSTGADVVTIERSAISHA